MGINELEARNEYYLGLAEEEFLNYAYSNDITINHIKGGTYDPDVAFTKDRVINMNPNYNSPIARVFRLGHEIYHIKYSKNGAFYAFTDRVDRQEERNAHYYSAVMLCNFFYQDTPIEYRRHADFMQWFNLPQSFESIVKDAVYEL